MADINQKRNRKPPQDVAFTKFRSAVLADSDLSLVKHERDRWQYRQPFAVLEQAGASLTLTPPDDGLVTLRYAGPVDLSFLILGHAWSEGSGRFVADAVILDFCQADIRFASSDLDTALICLRPEHLERPRALLVPPTHVRMFMEFALRLASTGVLQRTFIDRDAAETWARHQAARNVRRG